MKTLLTVAAATILMTSQSYAAAPAPAPHARIIGMQVSSANLKAGDTLTVTMLGTGPEAQCPTTVLLSHKGNNTYKVSDKVGTGAWPRVSRFVLTDPGQYLVRNLATESANLSDAEKAACGFHYSYGTSGIPGDNTVIDVVDIPK